MGILSIGAAVKVVENAFRYHEACMLFGTVLQIPGTVVGTDASNVVVLEAPK